MAGQTLPAKPLLRNGLAQQLLLTFAWACILAQILIVCWPLREGLDKYGGHDWDASLSFRYFVAESFRRFHQFPFWIPNCGGGYTAWGFVDSDTVVVSPWLPLYLLLDVRIAARLEILGTALLSAWGTWLFAGRFTRSIAGRTFACIFFVVNSRWSLQTTSGHAWHAYYAFMPWVFYFFDKAQGRALPDDRPSWKHAAGAGAFLAAMVYHGGIYPFPNALFGLGILGLALAIYQRSWRPILMGLVTFVFFLGLSAPRLFPIVDAFRKSPRLIESTETMDLRVFLEVLTNRNQNFGGGPVAVSRYGWHEWGMYVGWVPFLVAAAAMMLPGSNRQRAFKWLGLAFLVLSFGAFHDYAPWTLLHEAPVFRSLHVPSRWLYPAALVIGTLGGAALGRLATRFGQPRMAVEIPLLACVAAMAIDIGIVARTPMHQAFWMEIPAGLGRRPDFHQFAKLPASLRYARDDWSTPALPSIMANAGAIESTAVGPVNIFSKDETGKIPGQGAKGEGDPAYRGEFFTEGGSGRVSVLRWTPNEVEVRVEGAQPGDLLVMNQNFDPGWRANGRPSINLRDTVAASLTQPNEDVVFRYRPRTLFAGLLAFFVTLIAIVLGASEGARSFVVRPFARHFPPLRRWVVP
jgi:hypothetical protein